MAKAKTVDTTASDVTGLKAELETLKTKLEEHAELLAKVKEGFKALDGQLSLLKERNRLR